MLKATKYLGKVGVGITAPEFYKADDDELYVVKRTNNLLGKRVLISELLAVRIGKRIGLVFPPGDTIRLDNFLTSPDIKYTPHFASRYIADCRYANCDLLSAARNTKELAGILLFDHIFHNADRTNNRKNILFCQEENSRCFYAIDNSHLFKTGRWDEAQLIRLSSYIKTYTNYFYGALLREFLTAEDFTPYLKAFRALSADDIAAILHEIPEEWIESPDTIRTLLHYILTRHDLLNAIFDEILRYIPKKNGGFA